MTATILIVDDEEVARSNYMTFLTNRGYETIGAATLQEARDHLKRGSADIVLLDVMLPDGYGPSLLAEIQGLPVRPPVILVTAFAEIDMAVDAMKSGAHDFLQKPIQLSQLEQSVQRAVEIVQMRRELNHLRDSQQQKNNFVAGSNPVMQNVLSQARRAAAASVSVLITGENGTGKDVLARYIHRSGPRANKPFVDINCAAIQPTMLESEMFGHEAHAFTGADKRKLGLMEVADGGILFLDEISSMPLEIQAKLLRALESRTIRRVGGTTDIKVDVQIIAASNRNLPSMIRDNEFRQDLYYRLKVVDLDIPPLRERKGDIPELVGFFLRLHGPRLGVNIEDITPAAMQALMRYDWPGNIRELSNALERAMLFCDDPVLDIGNLATDLQGQNPPCG